jgi:hypothetical protein
MARERLNASPVEETPRLDRSREAARNQPAEQATRPRVDPNDPVPALKPSNLDLVRPHKPSTVDVDQLPVKDILLQQHLLRPPHKRLQIKRRLANRDRARRDRRDQLGGHEHRPTRNRRERPCHRRIVVRTQTNNQVIDPAQPQPICVANLPTQNQRKVEHLPQDRFQAASRSMPPLRIELVHAV